MQDQEFQILLEKPEDEPALSALCQQAFGPGRFTRTAYRIREGTPPVAELSLSGWLHGKIIAGIRFTALTVGGAPGALLLGPLVVAPEYNGKGYGKTLVYEGLTHAKEEGFDLVILVGDLPYYGRFGFRQIPHGQIVLPGPVDPDRLLACELREGALAETAGMVQGMGKSGARPVLAEVRAPAA